MKIKHISLAFALTVNIQNTMAQNKIKQIAGKDQLGGLADKFAELNDDILFGEIWSRTDKLNLRDRSLITVRQSLVREFPVVSS